MFLRNMLADVCNRSVHTNIPGNFTSYFQYRIGHYRPDYYLYFPKEPFVSRYYNEVFNKLQEYSAYELTKYLEFHYKAYNEKNDFLRFLRYELSERLTRKPPKRFCQKLRYSLEWVMEKQGEIRIQTEIILKEKKHQNGGEILFQEGSDANPKNIEHVIQTLSKKLTEVMEQLMASTEERMESLTSSYITGHIELNNHNHLEKLIQLLVLLQTVQAPLKIARAEQMFKRFSATDIASILHLHFEAFRDKKINTLQVKIREASERLNPANPKVQKLSTALQDFFY
ncbi:MAG TPA: hypothetical protein VFS22_06400 [Flavisolibacter sp.]|nr:hypothetical protein [Flavisolibacter sp.]